MSGRTGVTATPTSFFSSIPRPTAVIPNAPQSSFPRRRESSIQVLCSKWIPAFAGMTEKGAEMTRGAGVT